MQICPLVNPPAFKLWTRELIAGVGPGDQLHALVLVGSSAEGLIDSIWSPDWIREPYTRRRSYSLYTESMWSEHQLPKDAHMMVVHVDTVEVLARDSKLIEKALETVRAIVFLVPEVVGDAEFTATAVKRLGMLDNKLRPCFRVVLPVDMTRIGGVGMDKDRVVDNLPSSHDMTKPTLVRASASQLAQLQWSIAIFRAAASRAAAAQRGEI